MYFDTRNQVETSNAPVVARQIEKTRYVVSVLSGVRIASNANRTKEVGESVQKETEEGKTEETGGVEVKGAR